MFKSTTIALLIILVLAFVLRLYKINNPIADWHSWRQADTAAVARNFTKIGFNPILPRYDDISKIQSGKENPQGYRMVEFPVYQTVAFVFYRMFGSYSQEVWLRLVNIAASLITGIFLFKIISRRTGDLEGLFVAGVFLLLPYSVYYSRSILPEMFGVFLSVTSVYLLDIRDKAKKTNYLLLLVSAIFAALAVLTKPTMIFLLLPIIVIFMSNKDRFSKSNIFSLIIFGLITIIPLMAWRRWISNFPEGIPASDWLFNGGNIRFTGAFFRWLIAERLGKLLLGYCGLFFLFLGIAKKEEKTNTFFYLSFLAGIILYAIVIARGNVQHDYYQIPWLPAVSVFTGLGMSLLLKNHKNIFSFPKNILIVVVVSLLSFAFSWFDIRTYYWVNHPEIVVAGKRIDEITPKNAKVIAPYEGDTAFLYQTNRQGWPVVTDSIPDMVKKGADYLVIVNPDQPALNLEKEFKIIGRGEKYVIFNLRLK